MEHLLKQEEIKKLQNTFRTHPLLSICFKTFTPRMAGLNGLQVTQGDVFSETARLIDFLLSAPSISQQQVDALWVMQLNGIRTWKPDATDHDKQMVAGTIFHIARATLAQHYDSRFCETACDMLNNTLERKHAVCDEQEQEEFLRQLITQSPALSEWINGYDEADEWLSDEIAKAIAYKGGEKDGNSIKPEGGKPGAKAKSFREFIVNQAEADNVIDIIRQNIHKDNPQQAALLIVGAIEAGKVSAKVSAPSIAREFGVNESSIKPHLANYKSTKDTSSPHFSELEIEPYKALFYS